MRLFFLPLLFFIVVIGCVPHQPQSTIIFTSDEEGVLIISRPIDGFFNSWFPTDTVFLQPGVEFIYRVSIDPWGVVMSQLQGRRWASNVFIEKGGTVYVHKTREWVEFGGDNASLHNALINKRIGMAAAVDSLFRTENMNKIEAVINNPRLLLQMTRFYESLDSLFAKGAISSKAYHFGIRDTNYEIKRFMFWNFPEFRLMTNTERRYISLIGESFFDDEKVAFHPVGNVLHFMYSEFLFREMGQADRERLTAGISRETLGRHSHSLLLEGVSRLAFLFTVFVREYDLAREHDDLAFNCFDKVLFYEFLKSEFPESEAVQIIGRLVIEMGEREEEEKELLAVDLLIESVFPTELIANFSDLGTIEGLQGKYILVCLWASWCGPCRAQFRHNNRLRALLDSYNNVEKVYISIDTDVFRWEGAVEAWELSGIHLLASGELLSFLSEEVYQGERIFIPRYLLLDSQGNILNDDLALPSDMENLRRQLDEHLSRL